MTHQTDHPNPTPAPSEPTQKIFPTPDSEILTDRWPALHAAMQDYKKQIAADFSALAYRCVTDGIIRFDDRRRLAKAAHRANIRPFDAQLLIACAIRQHTLDQGLEKIKNRGKVPAPLHKPKSTWRSYVLLAGTVAALEALLAWLCLS